MANDSQRAKAASMFGKEFMSAAKCAPPPKNSAVALQKGANSRPIPTYKVGGPVKKMKGGLMGSPITGMPPGEAGPQTQALTPQVMPQEQADGPLSRMRGRRILENERKMPPPQAAVPPAAPAAPAGAMPPPLPGKMQQYKKGGKVQTSADTARKLATEMGGFKCGGMMKKASGGKIADEAVDLVGKYAVGGAGKTRKGQAPIKRAEGGSAKLPDRKAQKMAPMPKRDPPKTGGKSDAEYGDFVLARKMMKKAQGGAAKVRKGMMSLAGKITPGVSGK